MQVLGRRSYGQTTFLPHDRSVNAGMDTQTTQKSKQVEQTPLDKIEQPLADTPGKWWQNEKYITSLGYCLVLVPVVIYFILVSIYAVNIPYQDDYNAILEFLTKFKAAAFPDKIALLFSQHSDHRILHARVIYVLYEYIFGKINFVHLIFLGNLQLVVIYVVFIHFVRKVEPRYWSIVSLFIGLCLFDLSSYENADYAMCGITNYGVLMLFFVSLYCYSKSGNRSLMLAAFFELVCIFSSGGGLICALSLVLFTALSKEKTKSLVSASVLLVGALLYYFHYQKMTAMGTVSEMFTSTRDVNFFFHMLGNHFSFESGLVAGMCELALVLVLLPTDLKLLSKANFRPGALPFISILGVILGTSLSIAVFRSNDERLGELGSYASRYLIYTHMLAAVLFLLLWIKIAGRKKAWYAATIVAASLLLYAYVTNSIYGDLMMLKTQRRLETHPFYYKMQSTEDIAEAKKITADACKQGIYCIDDHRKVLQQYEENTLGVQITHSGDGGLIVSLPASDEKYLLTLLDSAGREIGDTLASARLSDITVNLKLPRGKYVLKVKNDNKEMYKKLYVK